jgi:hypothetical protein
MVLAFNKRVEVNAFSVVASAHVAFHLGDSSRSDSHNRDYEAAAD